MLEKVKKPVKILLIGAQIAPTGRRVLSWRAVTSLGDEGERSQISQTGRLKQFVKPFFGGYLRNPSEDPSGLSIVG